jgi:hypothetical protein
MEAVLRQLLADLPANWTAVDQVGDRLEQAVGDLVHAAIAQEEGVPLWAERPSALLGELWARGLIELQARPSRNAPHATIDVGEADRRAVEFTRDGMLGAEWAAGNPQYQEWPGQVHGRRAIVGYDAQIRLPSEKAPLPTLADLEGLSETEARVNILLAVQQSEQDTRSAYKALAAAQLLYGARLDSRPELLNPSDAQLRRTWTKVRQRNAAQMRAPPRSN